MLCCLSSSPSVTKSVNKLIVQQCKLDFFIDWWLIELWFFIDVICPCKLCKVYEVWTTRDCLESLTIYKYFFYVNANRESSDNDDEDHHSKYRDVPKRVLPQEICRFLSKFPTSDAYGSLCNVRSFSVHGNGGFCVAFAFVFVMFWVAALCSVFYEHSLYESVI